MDRIETDESYGDAFNQSDDTPATIALCLYSDRAGKTDRNISDFGIGEHKTVTDLEAALKVHFRYQSTSDLYNVRVHTDSCDEDVDFDRLVKINNSSDGEPTYWAHFELQRAAPRSDPLESGMQLKGSAKHNSPATPSAPASANDDVEHNRTSFTPRNQLANATDQRTGRAVPNTGSQARATRSSVNRPNSRKQEDPGDQEENNEHESTRRKHENGNKSDRDAGDENDKTYFVRVGRKPDEDVMCQVPARVVIMAKINLRTSRVFYLRVVTRIIGAKRIGFHNVGVILGGFVKEPRFTLDQYFQTLEITDRAKLDAHLLTLAREDEIVTTAETAETFKDQPWRFYSPDAPFEPPCMPDSAEHVLPQGLKTDDLGKPYTNSDEKVIIVPFFVNETGRIHRFHLEEHLELKVPPSTTFRKVHQHFRTECFWEQDCKGLEDEEVFPELTGLDWDIELWILPRAKQAVPGKYPPDCEHLYNWGLVSDRPIKDFIDPSCLKPDKRPIVFMQMRLVLQSSQQAQSRQLPLPPSKPDTVSHPGGKPGKAQSQPKTQPERRCQAQ